MKNEIIQVNVAGALEGKTVKQVATMLERAGVKLDPDHTPITALKGKMIFSGSATNAVRKKLAARFKSMISFFSNPEINTTKKAKVDP